MNPYLVKIAGTGLPINSASAKKIVGGIVAKTNKLDAKVFDPSKKNSGPSFAQRYFKVKSSVDRLNKHTDLLPSKWKAINNNIQTRTQYPSRGMNTHGKGIYGREGFPSVQTFNLSDKDHLLDPTKRRLP